MPDITSKLQKLEKIVNSTMTKLEYDIPTAMFKAFIQQNTCHDQEKRYIKYLILAGIRENRPESVPYEKLHKKIKEFYKKQAKKGYDFFSELNPSDIKEELKKFVDCGILICESNNKYNLPKLSNDVNSCCFYQAFYSFIEEHKTELED